ncbi:MAG: hypothetical protein NVSMB56_14850 [Pyrinomonadaceae bacterium]
MVMSEEKSFDKTVSHEFNLDAARLAYSIIQNLLEHARVTGDLVALMAQVLDEDTVKGLTATPYWSAYLDSRRLMERTSKDIEKFTEIMTKLSEEQGE